MKTLRWSLVGFALSLIIPSTALTHKFLGDVGTAVYLFLTASVLYILARYRDKLLSLAAQITDHQVVWLLGLTFFILLMAFGLVYPFANSVVSGRGSDCDDALNIAVRELLQGHYPYIPKTYLGNPISQMPGALILAIPFYLLGTSAYQNFFWLILFAIAMRSYLKDSRKALFLVWGIMVLAPIVPYQLFTGYDYIANSVYVLLFMVWAASAVPKTGFPGWKKILPVIGLGIGLSSRANFLLVTPLLFSVWVQQVGWKQAINYASIACAAWITVTLPFYLVDPDNFTPLQTLQELERFETVLPYAPRIIPVASVLLALLLAFYLYRCDDRNMLVKYSTVVLAFPVVYGVTLASWEAKAPTFDFAFFGTFFLFFGSCAFWKELLCQKPYN